MGNVSWSVGQQEELRRVHASRRTVFDPDRNEDHLQLLKSYSTSLMPLHDFERKGERWKKMGFQGKDPLTDIRSGGLLSVEVLEHFVTYYTKGAKRMMEEVNYLYTLDESRFYPFATTAVVLSAYLCDLVGISKKHLGAVKNLEEVLASGANPLFTNFFSSKESFNELFSLVFSQFHVTFCYDKQIYTYMDAQHLATQVVGKLQAVLVKNYNIGIEALKEIYFTEDPILREYLVPSGGHSKGWRRARMGVLGKRIGILKRESGVIAAVAGKSLFQAAIEQHAKEKKGKIYDQFYNQISSNWERISLKPVNVRAGGVHVTAMVPDRHSPA
jgi:hypothetical protein